MMEKIGTLNLTKLHVASHVTFHSSNLAAMQGAGFTNTTFTTLLGQYTADINLLGDVVRRQQASILTPEVKAADEARDATLRQLIMLIDAASYSAVAAEKEAAGRMQILIKPYRKDYKDMLTDETADIRGLLKTLGSKEEYVDDIDLLNLGAVIQRLKSQNNAFAAIYNERSVEQTTQAGAGISTTDQRKVADTTYKALVEILNGVVVATRSGIETGFDGPAMDTLTTAMNAYIAQYKTVLASQGKKKKEEEK